INSFTLIMGASAVFGLGMSLFGTEKSSSAASHEAQITGNIANLQIQENAVRQQAMEMSGRREKIEIARNTQIASARALAGATNQGAQFGSGIAGGQAQVQGEGSF